LRTFNDLLLIHTVTLQSLFAEDPALTDATSPSASNHRLQLQLASVIKGGPAPLIATWLFRTFHSGTAIAVYIALCAIITLAATAAMTDCTGKDISGEYRTR
jgi:uncharacterized membrane protein YjdF